MKSFKITRKEKKQLAFLVVFGIPTYLFMRGVYGIVSDVLGSEDSFLMMLVGLVSLLVVYYLFDRSRK